MSLAKWELVQKRAFTHWVNSQLTKRDVKLDSLEEGLQSGVHLIDLIEILTGKQVPSLPSLFSLVSYCTFSLLNLTSFVGHDEVFETPETSCS